MKLLTFELGKNVFQVRGTDQHRNVLVKNQLRRDRCERLSGSAVTLLAIDETLRARGQQ